jgi:hypothetical protein
MSQLHVVAAGSRYWTDEPAIRKAVETLPPYSRIAHGGCETGADPIVDRIARELGHEVVVYPAAWDQFKDQYQRNPAGPIRNRQMAQLEKPDVCLAFLLMIKPCPGTRNCIKECLVATHNKCEVRRFMR